MSKELLFLALITSLSYGCVATHQDLGSLYARQAKQEAQIKKLTRQLEDVSYQSGGAGSIEYDRQILELETRITNLEQAYIRITRSTQDQGRFSTLDPVNPEDAERFFNKQDDVFTQPPQVNVQDAIFTKGYNYLSENNYQECREQFGIFIKRFPNSPEVSDAAFWIAECYYRDGLFEESILEFQRFIESYENDIKIPLAFYKQGLALMNIDRNEEAMIFFQTLIDKFPKSEEARSAKEKLKGLE